MARNDAVKIGVAVVLLAGAATYTILAWGGSVEGVDDDDSKTEWFCTACEKPFILSGAQLLDQVVNQERDVDAGDAPEGGGDGKPQARGRGTRRTFRVAKCPTCAKWTGEAAKTCPDCAEVFLAATKRGQTAICPKCTWDPSTNAKAESDRLESGR